MKACPNIKLISVLATGYDVVDIEAAKQLGIAVCNIPAYGTYSVAQFAIALLLEVCYHVGYHDNAVKKEDGKTVLTGVSGISRYWNCMAKLWALLAMVESARRQEKLQGPLA